MRISPMARASIASLVMAALLGPAMAIAEDGDSDGKSPRGVVTRWLGLHLAGKSEAASELTTGSRLHRVHGDLTLKRDSRVIVLSSLGNERAAAVVVERGKRRAKDNEVFLFWLVRHDDRWRINKSDRLSQRIVDERLRGFLEADNVNWHPRKEDLVGVWDAGPGIPPARGGVCCGSELQLRADGTYRLADWGPAGPPADPKNILQGNWRLANGKISLSTGDRAIESRIAWLSGDQLILESAVGTGTSTYSRQQTTISSLP